MKTVATSVIVTLVVLAILTNTPVVNKVGMKIVGQ